MTEQRKSLEELLLEHGLLRPEQSEDIKRRAREQKKQPLDIIREENVVQPEVLARLQAELLQLPYVDISAVAINPEAMATISMRAAATYHIIPFEHRGERLRVAMANPDDVQALEAVRFIARKQGATPEIYLASREGIKEVLAAQAEQTPDAATVLREFDQQIQKKTTQPKQKKPLQISEEAPVTKTVAVIIRNAIEGGAQDIHIEPTPQEVQVRYRRGAKLYTSLTVPLSAHPAIIARLKVLAALQVGDTKRPQAGRFSLQREGSSYTLQVSTLPTMRGEKAVLHMTAKEIKTPSLEEIGLQGQQLGEVQQYLRVGEGLALISGPDGAGKTTTVYAALGTLNAQQLNIATLEKQIERELDGINQTQIDAEQGVTYVRGFKELLRQDVDVILVDDLHDQELASLMLHNAATTHRMMSSTHADDALGAIPYLAALGVPSYVIAAGTRLVMSQRLVPKLCQNCKQEEKTATKVRQEIREQIKKIPARYLKERGIDKKQTLFTSPGCPNCHESGYEGRIGIFEIVPITRQLRTAIQKEEPYEKLVESARKAEYISLREEGILKALQGIVRYQDVLQMTATIVQ